MHRRCAVCDTTLPVDSRADRITCSGACRTRVWRSRNERRPSPAHNARWLHVRRTIGDRWLDAA